MQEPRAPLIEMFWSVQGEGRFVGESMAFLRVATCPLRCSYCDTPHSYTAAAAYPVHGARGESQEPNPAPASRAAELVTSLRPLQHRPTPRVSITGGEPLVFPAFIRAVGERLRPSGWKVHLETAAIDAAALQLCAAQVDHLSADYKLPETIGGHDYGGAHVDCCDVALRNGASVDVKIVLTAGATEASLNRALTRLQPLRARILLVLQPVTPCLRETEPLPAAALERAIDLAVTAGFDLRVLPQVHKLLQVP
jgi:organic radical activating enzyme